MNCWLMLRPSPLPPSPAGVCSPWAKGSKIFFKSWGAMPGIGVDDPDQDIVCLTLSLNGNAAPIRIAGGIANQVENHLADAGPVTIDLGKIVGNVDLEP